MKTAFFLLLLVAFFPLYGGEGLKAEKKHKVINGDTLWGIALKYYGDGFKWGKIYNGNLDIIKNPDLIFPGMEIKLPEIEEIILPEIPDEKKENIIVSSLTVSTQNIALIQNSTQVIISQPQDKSIEIKSPVKSNENNQDIEILDGTSLNEEMPQSQIADPIMARTLKVGKNFFDGRIIEKENEDEIEKQGMAIEGDIVKVSLYKKNFSRGEKLILYKKGVEVADKITVQYAGIAKILDIGGQEARCQILKTNTAIDGEVFVKRAK